MDADYVFILNDLENALSGLPMVGAYFIEQKIKRAQEYEASFPSLRADYEDYFPKLKKSGVLNLEVSNIIQQFNLLLDGKGDEVGPSVRALLFADVRKIARFHFTRKAKIGAPYKVSPENSFVKDNFNNPAQLLMK